MRAIRRTFARIVGLLRDPRHREDDLRAEMGAHLEMETAENMRRGLSADDARRQAMVASGGSTQAAELTREQRRLPWIEGVLTDARYAFRHFRRTPLTTIIMILVLSLGVGTNVVLFTVLNSLVTMAAPGVQSDASLVRIRGIDRVQGRGNQLIRGRDFDARELIQRSDDGSHPVSFESVIIGDGLARRYWGAANPIGRRLQMAGARHVNEPPMVIVGVIDDAAAGPSEANGQIRVYVPYAPVNTGVIARTVGPAKASLEPMRKVVMDAAPQMPIYRAETMEQREAAFRRDVIRGGAVAAGGGLLALLLSAIGLYAVVSFSVGQRTREIGIRTALGAQRSTVVRMFLYEGARVERAGPPSRIATEHGRDPDHRADPQLADEQLAGDRGRDRGRRGRGSLPGCVDSGAAREHDRPDPRAANGLTAMTDIKRKERV